MSSPLVWCWILFAMVMLAHRRLTHENVAARAPETWLGIVVQAVGFGLAWMHRPHPPAAPALLATTSGWLATLLGLASVGLALSAAWALGRQWSVAARLLEDHQLVTRGPYRYLRHPIYAAMGGMLLATGLSVGSPVGLAAGFVVFALGTWVRIHFEEKLLAERFGPEFTRYAGSVPRFGMPRRQWNPEGRPGVGGE